MSREPSTEYGLKSEVYNQVVGFWRKAQNEFNFTDKFPKVDFTLKGSVGGQAQDGDLIRVNMAFLKNNKEHYLKHTIGHELAHNITHIIYGGKAKAHGKEWKSVMVRMGLEPSRTHNYSLQGIVPIYPYKCGCRVWELTKHRHVKIVNGKRYMCPHCKNVVVKDF